MRIVIVKDTYKKCVNKLKIFQKSGPNINVKMLQLKVEEGLTPMKGILFITILKVH
jgi:hypothetical protein